MRTPANAFKARTALNIKYSSINSDGGNDLMVSLNIMLGILKMQNSSNFFTFSEIMKTSVNMIKESKTLK